MISFYVFIIDGEGKVLVGVCRISFKTSIGLVFDGHVVLVVELDFVLAVCRESGLTRSTNPKYTVKKWYCQPISPVMTRMESGSTTRTTCPLNTTDEF